MFSGLLDVIQIVQILPQRIERRRELCDRSVKSAQLTGQIFTGGIQGGGHKVALLAAGGDQSAKLTARAALQRIGALTGGKLDFGDMRLDGGIFVSLRLEMSDLRKQFGFFLLQSISLRTQGGDLRGSLISGTLQRIDLSRQLTVGIGKAVALLCGRGSLCAQICIFAAETVVFLLKSLNVLLVFKGRFFNITDYVIAVEAAEDGAFESVFHIRTTFVFLMEASYHKRENLARKKWGSEGYKKAGLPFGKPAFYTMPLQ